MRQIALVGFLALTLFSCTQNQRIEGSPAATSPMEVESVSFKIFADKTTPVTLPLTIACDEELPGSDLGMPEQVIARFGPENAKVYGKLADTEKYTALIYTVPADISLPVIQTTDKEGNKISELPLFEKWCGEDEFSTGTSWAEITKNKTIILSDSVVLYSRNEAGEIIEKSRKTEVRHRRFIIAEDGRINEKH